MSLERDSPNLCRFFITVTAVQAASSLSSGQGPRIASSTSAATLLAPEAAAAPPTI